MTKKCFQCGGEHVGTFSCVPSGPPFTVERYGSLGDCIVAERDWLRAEFASVKSWHQAQWDLKNKQVDQLERDLRRANSALVRHGVEQMRPGNAPSEPVSAPFDSSTVPECPRCNVAHWPQCPEKSNPQPSLGPVKVGADLHQCEECGWMKFTPAEEGKSGDSQPDLWTCDHCAGPPRPYEEVQCILGACKPVRTNV